ncbi:MAG: carboxypeptidase regulatory-like domain-containing protein [Bryobacteraceae bacterium]
MLNRLLVIATALPLATSGLLAQITAGSITGLVSDQSQAIVPNAKITVTNQSTGLTRETASNTAGEYRVPLLPPGIYTINAAGQGFKGRAVKDVKLETQQVVRVDFQFELGSVQETVTVDAQAAQLETESTVTGTVIKQEQVTNLPLNVRQFMQMVFLSPFAIPASRDFRSTEIARDTAVASGGGARPEDNNYQIDGFDNQESGRHGFSVSPPVDSIAEFKVQTGTASAEFGHGAGTMINVVTKSGSNQIHGTVYEFLRNNNFDARNFFASRVSPLKRNQFGGALGGPVIRNKIFYFGNYEGFRQRSAGNPTIGRVPTADERTGIFTVPVRDPVTGTPFSSTDGRFQIPASRFNPTSAKIVPFWPNANTNDVVARNYRFDRPSAPTDRNNATVRGDYNVTSADNLYVRWVLNDDKSDTPPNFPNNAGGRKFSLRAWTLGGHYNRVFSPRLVNDFGLGYMFYRNRNLTYNSNGTNYFEQVGILNVLAYTNPLMTGYPGISIPGYLNPGEQGVNYRSTNTLDVTDNLSWQVGRHGLRFGGAARHVDTEMFYLGFNSSHEFANRYSGDNFADFLLGVPSSLNKTARAVVWNNTKQYYALYFHDDWKVTPRLTVNFGLRWEIETPIKSPRNALVGFDHRTGETLLSQNIENKQEIERFYTQVRPDIKIKFIPQTTMYNADRNNFAPRIGLAYQLRSRTVLRAGMGTFFIGPQVSSLTSGEDYPPLTYRPIWSGDPTRPVLVLPGGTQIPTGYNPEGSGGLEATVRFPSPLTIFPIYSRHLPYSENYQWMSSIQQQVTSSLLVEAQYLGSRTNHLMGFHNTNYAQPAPGAIQNRLPYPSFARIQGYHFGLDGWYHGMGLKAEQRLKSGMMFSVAYTWSKAMDTGSTLNQSPVFNNVDNFWKSAKGLSDFDVRHRFVTSYQFEVPVGKGKRFASDASRAANLLIGGWGVRGVTVAQSGFSYTPTMNLNRANFCATACVARPDRIADGNVPKSERTIERFWDLTAFVLPPPTAPRHTTSGRNILRGPGLINWDFGVFKNFQITESKRLEFRYETFNTFNHANFLAPASNAEAPAVFGRITGADFPRISQFVLKLIF